MDRASVYGTEGCRFESCAVRSLLTLAKAPEKPPFSRGFLLLWWLGGTFHDQCRNSAERSSERCGERDVHRGGVEFAGWQPALFLPSRRGAVGQGGRTGGARGKRRAGGRAPSGR